MKFPYQAVSAISPDLHGFYKISNEAYHAGPGISSTQVKSALESHAQFVQKTEDSAAMAFGRYFHTALLEPHLLSQWSVIPGSSQTNAYKAALAASPNSIASQDAEKIPAMIKAVESHPDFSRQNADPEIMGITRCKETGLLKKCKGDLFGSAIWDFKTTRDGVTQGDFMHTIINFKYHVSAAFYQDIYFDLLGERLPFYLMPVTKTEPFETEIYRLSDEILDEGRRLYQAGMRRISRWANMTAAEVEKDGKKIRTLYPNARMVAQTKEILDFIEGAL